MEPNTNASTTSGDAPGSICPQGWTLPPNAGDGSYYNLLTTYGISDQSKLVAAPFSFSSTGGYNWSSGVLYLTNIGFYWSRTVKDVSNAYHLNFGGGSVNSQNSSIRGLGLPVRYVGSKLLALPLEFGYTGAFNYSVGYLVSEGSSGRYWSRVAVSGTNARNLYFTTSSIGLQNSYDRGSGRAVRCQTSKKTILFLYAADGETVTTSESILRTDITAAKIKAIGVGIIIRGM